MLTRENKIYFVWAKEVWDIEAQCCHSRWVKEETHKLSLLPGQGHDSCVVLMPTRHLLKLPPLDLLICILAFSTLGVPEAHSKCCVSRHMSSHIHFWLDPEWCLLVRDEAGQPLCCWELNLGVQALITQAGSWPRTLGWTAFGWSGVISLVTRGTRLCFP